MKQYKLGVKGSKNGMTHSFEITVPVIEDNFKRYGSFKSWAGGSMYKKDVAVWLNTFCPGYTELSIYSIREL